jgi:hypothetical protein
MPGTAPNWLSLRQHPYLHLRHLLRAAVDHHHRRLRLRLPRVPRQKTLFLMFLVQLMIMPGVMMVPNMLTLKTFGLLQTGVMMPYFTSAFGVFLMRQAFLAIPKSWKRRR